MEFSANSNIVQRINRAGADFLAQLEEVSSPLRWIDILVFALILGFGAVQFLSCDRARDFSGDDVFFADSARSLIEHGFYGINGQMETNMPPGVSYLFALLYMVGPSSHAVFLRTMTLFGALGFLAAYELLRRQAPRGIAAAICLLLISSRVYWMLVTQVVYPSFPYFFTTMAALLVAGRFEKATHPTARIGWGAALTAFIAASLVLASAAIAFLGAIVATICASFFRDRHSAFVHLKTYLPILLVGIAVQAICIQRNTVEASAGISAQEWPIPGFPQSYLSQLKVKDGNYPELGMAGPRDIAFRMFNNACEYANLLSRLILRRLPDFAWMSIFVTGPILLVGLGWCQSIWRTGGRLEDWYFAGYQGIYFLWPWHMEARFFLPVAPLACLYMWRGGQTIVSLARNKPRVLGLAWLPMAILLAASAWFSMRGVGIATRFPNVGLDDELSLTVWLMSALLAGWMIRADTAWMAPIFANLRRSAGLIGGLRISPARFSQCFGVIAVVGLIVLGLPQQLEIARANLDPNSATKHSPDAEAAIWISSHTDSGAVVMARHVPTAFHYSKRKVIWFPPSSNAPLLMEGILKHQIEFLIVVHREHNYYLPSDDDCFTQLFTAYPTVFRLVNQAPEYRIFQVTKPSAIAHQVTLGAIQ
jgi:hypothetical protein